MPPPPRLVSVLWTLIQPVPLLAQLTPCLAQPIKCLIQPRPCLVRSACAVSYPDSARSKMADGTCLSRRGSAGRSLPVAPVLSAAARKAR